MPAASSRAQKKFMVLSPPRPRTVGQAEATTTARMSAAQGSAASWRKLYSLGRLHRAGALLLREVSPLELTQRRELAQAL